MPLILGCITNPSRGGSVFICLKLVVCHGAEPWMDFNLNIDLCQ